MDVTEPPPEAIRVLFVHGLESGPRGGKVRLLREQGFEVAAADMHMSMWRLRKRNSVGRSLISLPEPIGLAIAVALAVAGGAWAGLWALALSAPVVGAAIAALRWRSWVASALALSRARCVAIQERALAEHAPQVVVGSSWGGAVVAELIASGAWRGPTVLLAPAIRKVQERIDPSGYPTLLGTLHEAAEGAPLVVFHDPADDVVPFEGSRDLASSPAVRLHEIQGGGHRLLGILEDGRLSGAIRALARSGGLQPEPTAGEAL